MPTGRRSASTIPVNSTRKQECPCFASLDLAGFAGNRFGSAITRPRPGHAPGTGSDPVAAQAAGIGQPRGW